MAQYLKYSFPALGALILLTCLGAAAFAFFTPEAAPRYEGDLVTILPEKIPGWESEDLPLGATESLDERSKKILRYDDYAYREYRQGDWRFSVYVSYWKPGKMPIRLIHQHTPDRCWLENGWECLDREWNVDYEAPQGELPPAQWGLYELRNQETNTIFWHIVDGEPYWPNPGELNTRTRATTFIKELLTFGLALKREQMIVRFNSNQPFDRIWPTPAFQEVLKSLQTNDIL